jgi:hypothetical protein
MSLILSTLRSTSTNEPTIDVVKIPPPEKERPAERANITADSANRS